MNPARHAYSYLFNFVPRLQELPMKNPAVCSCTPDRGMCVVPCIPVLQLVLGGLWLLCLGEVEEIPCICSFRGGMYLICATGTGLGLYSRQEWKPEEYQKSIAFIFVWFLLDVFNKWRSKVAWMLEKWKVLKWHFPFKRNLVSDRPCSPNVRTLSLCTWHPGITLGPLTRLALSVRANGHDGCSAVSLRALRCLAVLQTSAVQPVVFLHPPHLRVSLASHLSQLLGVYIRLKTGFDCNCT